MPVEEWREAMEEGKKDIERGKREWQEAMHPPQPKSEGEKRPGLIKKTLDWLDKSREGREARELEQSREKRIRTHAEAIVKSLTRRMEESIKTGKEFWVNLELSGLPQEKEREQKVADLVAKQLGVETDYSRRVLGAEDKKLGDKTWSASTKIPGLKSVFLNVKQEGSLTLSREEILAKNPAALGGERYFFEPPKEK